MNNEFEELLNIFLSINNKKNMGKLFEELFTESERKDLVLRWQLLKELSLKTPQREIAKKFHLSLCKITRGSKILQNKKSICKKLISDNISSIK